MYERVERADALRVIIMTLALYHCLRMLTRLRGDLDDGVEFLASRKDDVTHRQRRMHSDWVDVLVS